MRPASFSFQIPSRISSGIVFLVVHVILVLSSFPLAAQGLDSDSVKYWIFFNDKPESGFLASKTDRVEISVRTHERRIRRATHVSPELDRKVYPPYLEHLQAGGIRVKHTSRWLNAASAYLSKNDIATVLALPFVDRIRPVARGTVSNQSRSHSVQMPPVPMAPLDYGNSFTQLDKANVIPNLEQGINGSGVRLGIIDTGIGNLSHQAFSLMLAEGRLIESRDFTDSLDDGNRHARNVLSIAAGYYEGFLIGPAYGAEILHARTEYTRTETTQEEDDFVAGLEWMESEGVDVVNVSLSYTEFDGGIGDYTYADMNGETAITTIAADVASSLGVVMVISAGNDGGCTPGTCWYYIGSPADGNSVITVGATTSEDQRASFSSFGPSSDGRIKPDISAMGVSVAYACSDTVPESICVGNGTSYSAPLVAGIVAEMLQVNPFLMPAQVLDIIRQTARIPVNTDKTAVVFPNNSLGWGIVDGAAAVALAIAVSNENDAPLPAKTVISNPFPNPASSEIRFIVSGDQSFGDARLELFDVLGRRVLASTAPVSRDHASFLRFSLDGLPAGPLLYRLTIGNDSQSGTLVVLN